MKLLSLCDKKNVRGLQKLWEHDGAHSLWAQVASATRHAWYPFAYPSKALSNCTIRKDRILRRLVVDYRRQTRRLRKSDTRSSATFVAPRFTANNLTDLSARYTSFLDLGEFLSSKTYVIRSNCLFHSSFIIPSGRFPVIVFSNDDEVINMIVG